MRGLRQIILWRIALVFGSMIEIYITKAAEQRLCIVVQNDSGLRKDMFVEKSFIPIELTNQGKEA